MDVGYHAKYRILKNVFNNYPADTISFDVYDHYEKPAFFKDKYVLLFVFKAGGKLYHEKYIYFSVHPTIDGNWASACDVHATRFTADYKKLKEIAVPIQFKEHLSFKIRKVVPEKRSFYYSPPYFKIKGKKAIPLLGTYVDDLFKIEAEGILKNRGYFK